MPAKEQCFHGCSGSFPSRLVVKELFILDLPSLPWRALSFMLPSTVRQWEMPNVFCYQRAVSLTVLSALTGNEAWHSQMLMPREGNYLAISYR